MYFDPRLCESSRRAGNEPALRAWGLRVGLRARDAIWLNSCIPELTGQNIDRTKSILDFFGADTPTHAFRFDPVGWLNLTEPQATRALAQLITAGGSARVLAFLRALSSDIVWPAKITKAKAEAEVRAGHGRVDLLITGKAEEKTWGAVIEAKLEHRLINDLSPYRKLGKDRGLEFRRDTETLTTGLLIVIGKVYDIETRKKMKNYRDWRFINWSSFLRRFEQELTNLPDDDDFRQFRRTLWERIS